MMIFPRGALLLPLGTARRRHLRTWVALHSILKKPSNHAGES